MDFHRFNQRVFQQNRSIPVSPKRPFPLLAPPGANFAVDPIRMRAIRFINGGAKP